jgi:hypothetical protein
LNKEKIKRINQSTFLVFDLFHALCVPLPSKSAQTYRPLPTIERNNTFFPSFSRSTKATYYYWTHSPLFLIHSERRGNLRVHYSGFFAFWEKRFWPTTFNVNFDSENRKRRRKKNLNDCWTTLSYLYHYMCVCFSFSFFGLLKEKKKKIPASVC